MGTIIADIVQRLRTSEHFGLYYMSLMVKRMPRLLFTETAYTTDIIYIYHEHEMVEKYNRLGEG